MQSYSLTRVLSLIIIAIMYMKMGDVTIYVSESENYITTAVKAVKGKLVISALIYIIFGYFSEEEKRKSNIRGSIDEIVSFLYAIAMFPVLPLGLAGLIGYIGMM